MMLPQQRLDSACCSTLSYEWHWTRDLISHITANGKGKHTSMKDATQLRLAKVTVDEAAPYSITYVRQMYAAGSKNITVEHGRIRSHKGVCSAVLGMVNGIRLWKL